MRTVLRSRRGHVVANLSLLSVASLGFFIIGSLNSKNWGYWYLIWNLLLAWIPLALSALLVIALRTRPWLTWLPITLTILWIGFLPNSFYLVSDLIHLQDISINILFNSVMFEIIIINGLLLGFFSLYLVHEELLRRINRRFAASLIGLALLSCSFAIYLGRDLRWNSWDLLVNPAGVLFDVSDPFLNPSAHPQAFTTTLTFFIFLVTLYVVAWNFSRFFGQRSNKVG